MEEITLDSIVEMTVDQETRLNKLLSKEEFVNGVSAEESRERTGLIFLREAFSMKVLATDEFVDDKADANYENQAIKYYEAYLTYSS